MTSPSSPSCLDWRDEWTLNVAYMDEDHRHLSALVNRLAWDYGTCAVPGQPIVRPGAPPLSDALDELAREARLHFQREEESMRTKGYRDFDDHKADHDLLLAELSVLARELTDQHASYLDGPVLDTLKDWLLGHGLDFDRRLAEFLKHPSRRESAPVSSD